MEISNLKEEIYEKNTQIASLQKQIEDSINPQGQKDILESQVI